MRTRSHSSRSARGSPPNCSPRPLIAASSDFGESYLQEALAKIAALRERRLTWHFIGRVQTNKTRAIAEHFAWVHALDRLKVAERLAAQRPPHAPPLNVCLQVNVAGEAGKGGAPPAEVPGAGAAVAQLPRLALRGLMCIPPEETELARQRAWFARLRAAQGRAQRRRPLASIPCRWA